MGPLLAAVLVLSWAAAVRRASAAEDVGTERDPLECVNRKIFWFNDKVDVYVLAPVARGWEKVSPHCVRTSVSNFFGNLRFPIVTVNDLLQGKVKDGASDVGRFGVNTTVGVLGLFDPASGWGLVKHDEDFGQTLGVWGVPPGAYLVLPLLGPSDPRDAAGFAVDYALSVTPFFIDEAILWGAQVADTVNARSFVLKQVEDAKASAFDYYVFVRNAYLQRRRALVRDLAETSAEESEELYHPEFDLEEKP
ncbi:MAG: VacJ family lipoprotein [Deltaproteobacteria bacterium]|nr:MAG: VacJ family lipoprotein [Deltaproteobacteria bacterium]